LRWRGRVAQDRARAQCWVRLSTLCAVPTYECPQQHHVRLTCAAARNAPTAERTASARFRVARSHTVVRPRKAVSIATLGRAEAARRSRPGARDRAKSALAR